MLWSCDAVQCRSVSPGSVRHLRYYPGTGPDMFVGRRVEKRIAEKVHNNHEMPNVELWMFPKKIVLHNLTIIMYVHRLAIIPRYGCLRHGCIL